MNNPHNLLILIAMIPAWGYAAPTLNGEPQDLAVYLLEQRKLIVISGSGEETAKADSAVVSLMVKTKESRLHQALDKNRSIRADIRQRLINAGIAEDKIQFSKYSSTPNYGWFGEKPSSYEITNEIKVTLDAEEKLLTLADIVDTVDAVFLVKTELTHSDKKQSEANALASALQHVSDKKQLYEQKLGVSLSPVRIIEQSAGAQTPATVWAPKLRKSATGSLVSGGLEETEFTPAPAAEGGFGEIIYHAQIQVEYTVMPR